MGAGWSANLCDNFGIRVQLQETSSKLGGHSMIVHFHEDIDSVSEGNLHMWHLHCVMREVCCEFKTFLNVIRVFFSNTPLFKLYRDAQQIFTPSSNSVSSLLEYVNKGRTSCENNYHAFAFIVRRDYDKQ
jgi:hypothetical protein